MMKKLVMKVDPKSRTKTLKIAVSIPGATSATLEGSDEDELVVVGNEVGSHRLLRRLRKKMGYAEVIRVELERENIESVEQVRDNIENKDEEGGGEKKDKGGGGEGGGGSKKTDKPDDSEEKDKEGGGRAGEKNDKANGN